MSSSNHLPGSALRLKPWSIGPAASLYGYNVEMTARSWAGVPVKGSDFGKLPVACTPAMFALLAFGSEGWKTANITHPDQEWGTGKVIRPPPRVVQIVWERWRPDESPFFGPSLYSQFLTAFRAAATTLLEEHNVWCDVVREFVPYWPGTRQLPFHDRETINRDIPYSSLEVPDVLHANYTYGVLDPERWSGREFLQLWITGCDGQGPFCPLITYDRVWEDYLVPDPFGNPLGPPAPPDGDPGLASVERRITGYTIDAIVLEDAVEAATQACSIFDVFLKGRLDIAWGFNRHTVNEADINVTWFTFLPTFPFPTYVEYAYDSYPAGPANDQFNADYLLAQEETLTACEAVAAAAGGSCTNLGELPTVAALVSWAVERITAFLEE